MKIEPKPKQELSVTKHLRHIRLTPHSGDAKEFILKHAPKYGSCITIDNTFSLEILDGYNINEVTEYFESYND